MRELQRLCLRFGQAHERTRQLREREQLDTGGGGQAGSRYRHFRPMVHHVFWKALMIPSFISSWAPLRWSAVVVCSLAVADPAPAAGDVPGPQSTGSGSGATMKSSPSRVVTEGGVERPLWLDTGRVIEFNKPGTSRPVIRPAEAGEPGVLPTAVAPGSAPASKSDAGGTGKDSTEVSPVFLDATGQPRGLPGGVIVSLRQELPEAQARARLQDAGLTPLRQLGARMWLVDSPVGVASLDLADRLQADDRFEFAQPNWWRPRATK